MAKSKTTLSFLPVPKIVEYSKGAFALAGDKLIALTGAPAPELMFAAHRLQAARQVLCDGCTAGGDGDHIHLGRRHPGAWRGSRRAFLPVIATGGQKCKQQQGGVFSHGVLRDGTAVGGVEASDGIGAKARR